MSHEFRLNVAKLGLITWNGSWCVSMHPMRLVKSPVSQIAVSSLGDTCVDRTE